MTAHFAIPFALAVASNLGLDWFVESHLSPFTF
jgi:hypothetical protein